MEIQATIALSLDDHVGAYESAPTIREKIIRECASILLRDGGLTEKAVHAAVREVASEEARKSAQEIVASEFQPRDRYGHPAGKPVLLRAYIADLMRGELILKDTHGSGTIMTQLIREEVQKVVNGELKAAMDEAKKQIGEALRAAATEALAKQLAK